jgi:hypothetical protein
MHACFFSSMQFNWRFVVSSTFRPLYSRGNSPRYPLDMRLDWLKSESGSYGGNPWPSRDSKFDPTVVQSVVSRCTDCATALPEVLFGNLSGEWENPQKSR